MVLIIYFVNFNFKFLANSFIAESGYMVIKVGDVVSDFKNVLNKCIFYNLYKKIRR